MPCVLRVTLYTIVMRLYLSVHHSVVSTLDQLPVYSTCSITLYALR